MKGKSCYVLAPFEVEDICKRFVAGESVPELAKAYGISTPTIYKHVPGLYRQLNRKLGRYDQAAANVLDRGE